MTWRPTVFKNLGNWLLVHFPELWVARIHYVLAGCLAASVLAILVGSGMRVDSDVYRDRDNLFSYLNREDGQQISPLDQYVATLMACSSSGLTANECLDFSPLTSEQRSVIEGDIAALQEFLDRYAIVVDAIAARYRPEGLYYGLAAAESVEAERAIPYWFITQGAAFLLGLYWCYLQGRQRRSARASGMSNGLLFPVYMVCLAVMGLPAYALHQSLLTQEALAVSWLRLPGVTLVVVLVLSTMAIVTWLFRSLDWISIVIGLIAAPALLFLSVIVVGTLGLEASWVVASFFAIYAGSGLVFAWYGYWSRSHLRLAAASSVVFLALTPWVAWFLYEGFDKLRGGVLEDEIWRLVFVGGLLPLVGMPLVQPLLNRIRNRPG